MKKILTTFFIVFLLMIFVIVGIGIISVNLDIEKARDYKADVIAEIENSNFNTKVIASCIDQATEAGYELEVTPIVTDTETNQQIATIVLKYQYTFKILNINNTHEIRGYAR